MADIAQLLRGAVETHVHSSPDVVPRRLDDFELARQAEEAGLRAVVLKSHHTLTADRAQHVRKAVPGVETFGGLALNYPVGGLNPIAVETALNFGARVIWMPTFHAANHVAKMQHAGDSPLLRALGSCPDGGIAIRDGGGQLKPVVHAILRLIAERDATLATGHLAPAETEALVDAALAAGVRRVLVTHPELDIIAMPLEMQARLAQKGAMLERCFIVTTMGFNAKRLAEAIRAVGVASTVMATDFGQLVNPPPVEGLRAYVRAMLDEDFAGAEIEQMLHYNPAKVLGLES
ncbi:MAG: hypothetical protein HYU88_12340 [Chloroflexi bacterium]|nr:hypothetical protein [Chloroflexota bacterium]MBI4503909.1 hypothetical protein [Chloroflexota bacterium]